MPPFPHPLTGDNNGSSFVGLWLTLNELPCVVHAGEYLVNQKHYEGLVIHIQIQLLFKSQLQCYLLHEVLLIHSYENTLSLL